MRLFAAAMVLLVIVCAPFLRGQDNYEIQVYGSETQQPGTAMLELHSNYTIDGSEEVVDGVYPTKSALHETVELTFGLTSYFELGSYLFTSARSGDGWQIIGSHIRPRVRAPEEWDWPVGASLSFEVGYQRPEFSVDTWSIELRPIIDKQFGNWYISFNPTTDISVKGLNQSQGFEFSPNLKFAYTIIKEVTAGIEYYGSLGPVTGFDPGNDQQHQIFPSIDLDLSPQWEINAGLGWGITPATDHLIAKIILGRRFGI